ncbi:MAG TPA: energy transducer TonB [Porphyromonadaceae bacterium]|jgi:protein TonB|uniref:energy transducer TonB n=1 Tax=Limibacterium fermenti TaxID=3229863 RepID=UPI000E7F9C28|nr:energy transducer TonB [Porphyromonadaceae bacterium]HBL33565.1 energy transducer TonB [Porphyromonadaceae bacterium]HBX20100.1 energy transducer TonB [Porphyromonadaceae bacterium]HBX45710.1 energy transducer TonB [Porphyromonadaceae bacterium]HCM20369.1 energy transducer TonB [Porphyromonadaceae bacterium]
MAKDINLTSQEWIDLIFEGKNKSYGAYRLRQSSGRRHLYAFIVVIVIAVLLFIAMSLITTYESQRKAKEAMTQVTTLTDIQLEQPEVPEENQVKQYVAPPPVELKSTIKFTPPVIKKDEDVREDQEMKSQEFLTQSDVQISIADVKGNNEETGVDIATLRDHKVIVQAEPEPEKIFDVVEQPASFPGGNTALMKWLNDNIQYPVIAQENGIEGRVIVQFVVGSDGAIQDIKVARGVDPSLDKEATRLVREMPKWIPGRQGGTAVKVRFTLPIVFQLQK